MGLHFFNGLYMNDDFPVDAEEILWGQLLFQLIQCILHDVPFSRTGDQEGQAFLCFKIMDLTGGSGINSFPHPDEESCFVWIAELLKCFCKSLHLLLIPGLLLFVVFVEGKLHVLQGDWF